MFSILFLILVCIGTVYVLIVYGIYASMCWPINLFKQCDTYMVMVEIEVINKVM